MDVTSFTFADNAADDRDIAIFTKRLDTLLMSAVDDIGEADRLPAALTLLSRDEHFSPAFQGKLVKALAIMNRLSVANIQPEIDRSKREQGLLDERVKWSDPANRKQQEQFVSDRKAMQEYIADLEKKRKQKAKFPTRSTFEAFTSAVAEAKLVPDFYVLALENAFDTPSTLRKILQSLLALWGFESQFKQAVPEVKLA